MKKRVLIIDDIPTIGQIISLCLGEVYDLQYFDNPLDAIKWMQNGNIPDLIVSDVYMPKMTGEEFFHFIKKNLLFKHIPFIFLSGEEDSSMRIRLLEEGAEDFILKPFNPLELKVRLKKVLR